MLLLLAAPLGAQQASTPEAVLAALVRRGPVVRLRTDQARMTGKLLAAGNGVATLQAAGATRIVALSAVDTVWVRGRAVVTGAIVGGAAGMVALGALTSVLASGLCESDCSNAGTEGALIGGAVGLGGGALLGAAIGAAIPRWKRRFP
jgi:hypothetical protein